MANSIQSSSLVLMLCLNLAWSPAFAQNASEIAQDASKKVSAGATSGVTVPTESATKESKKKTKKRGSIVIAQSRFRTQLSGLELCRLSLIYFQSTRTIKSLLPR
jgi:hypothetical protein